MSNTAHILKVTRHIPGWPRGCDTSSLGNLPHSHNHYSYGLSITFARTRDCAHWRKFDFCALPSAFSRLS
ncbi:hypothetical protein K438DRAFT_663633 [Mycena galopus ATCC 62051]|nr:hypothetical protein K438DRAFT_663633 [Mycena galopus ATCC 62051]